MFQFLYTISLMNSQLYSDVGIRNSTFINDIKEMYLLHEEKVKVKDTSLKPDLLLRLFNRVFDTVFGKLQAISNRLFFIFHDSNYQLFSFRS